MDPDKLVDEMINIVSELDGMPKGPERTALLLELSFKRHDLKVWRDNYGFEPKMGWRFALSL